MPPERVSMRRVRDPAPQARRRRDGSGERPIAGIARSTVALTPDRTAAAALYWPLPVTLSDRVLEAVLYAGPGSQRGLAAQGRAGLDARPSRAAPARRHPGAAAG